MGFCFLTRTATLNHLQQLLRILRGKAWVSAAELSKTLAISRERMSELLRPLIAAHIVLREGLTRATTYRLKPKS